MSFFLENYFLRTEGLLLEISSNGPGKSFVSYPAINPVRSIDNKMWSRGHSIRGQGQTTSKIVLEDILETKDILEDSTYPDNKFCG